MALKRKYRIVIALAILLLILVQFKTQFGVFLKPTSRTSKPTESQMIANEARQAQNYESIPADDAGLGTQIRLFSSAFRAQLTQNETHVLFEDVQSRLFPWLDSMSLYNSYDGRGIVMTTGDRDLAFTLHSIRVIRTMLDCMLPIEIFVMPDELEEDGFKLLKSEYNVKMRNMVDCLDVESIGISSFDVKPYAILCSSFAEAIFMDGDAIFFQSPEILFDLEGYKETGAFYFRDRTLRQDDQETFESEAISYLDALIPNPSRYILEHSRMWGGQGVHEVDSGVMVLNKKIVFEALLLSTLLNLQVYRNAHFWGDKEYYWIAHEILNSPFRFEESMGGAIGYLQLSDENQLLVCGGLYHADENLKPLWFNGGMYKDKYLEDYTTLQITHWSAALTVDENSFYDGLCMYVKFDKSFGALDAKQLEFAEELAYQWESVLDEVYAD